MEPVCIRACTHQDIDAILQLDRQWEQEQIAHDFTPISRDEYLAALDRFPTYFLVAECDGGLVGYINAAVRLRKWVAVGALGARAVLEVETGAQAAVGVQPLPVYSIPAP